MLSGIWLLALDVPPALVSYTLNEWYDLLRDEIECE